MSFQQQLKSLVDKIGTNESAKVCGVTPRSLQLWIKGNTPCSAMQAGVILLLSRVKIRKS